MPLAPAHGRGLRRDDRRPPGFQQHTAGSSPRPQHDLPADWSAAARATRVVRNGCARMKVSILIPTKNRLALLQEAVASARAQTHGDIEILVSDDGSNDGTGAWLEQLTTSDNRVRLAPRNPTPGLFENINHLLDHQRGE